MPLDFIIAPSSKAAEANYKVSCMVNLEEHEELMSIAKKYEMPHLQKLDNYWGAESVHEIPYSSLNEFSEELARVPGHKSIKKLHSVILEAMRNKKNIYTFGD